MSGCSQLGDGRETNLRKIKKIKIEGKTGFVCQRLGMDKKSCIL